MSIARLATNGMTIMNKIHDELGSWRADDETDL
jgi:hypothetical protein